jgi:hypothetical protein
MMNRVSSTLSNYDQVAIAHPDISIKQSSCNIHFNWYWLMLFRLLGVCGSCGATSREDSSQEKFNSQGLQHLSKFGVERELWQ